MKSFAPEPGEPRHTAFTVAILTCLVFLTALSVLFGWLFDIRTLKSVLPQLTTMKANTAICLALLAAAVWLSHTRASRRRWIIPIFLLTAAVALLAALVAAEYAFQWNLGIDQFFFQGIDRQVTLYPGRFAPGTAVCFLFLSTALMLLDSRPRTSQCLTIAAILIALVSLTGYVDNLPTLYGAGRFTSLALHTILCLLTLSIALMACRPDRGLTRILTRSASTQGTYTRVLFLAALAGPILLGSLVLRAQASGGYGAEFSLALFSVLLVVLGVTIVWLTESDRQKLEDKRRQTAHALSVSEQRLRLAMTSSALGIWDFNPLTGQRHWDDRCRAIFGFPPDFHVDSAAVFACIHPEDRDSVQRAAEEYIRPAGSGRFAMEYRIFVYNEGSLKYIFGQGQTVFEGEMPHRRAVRAVGTMQDITALKQGEQNLRRVNQELEQFAYAAAHDLQEPLRNVCLATQMLAAGYRGRFDADADRLLDLASESPLRMQAMVQDLLAYSRALSSEDDTSEDDTLDFCDANAVIASAIQNLQTAVDEKQAKVTWDSLPSVRIPPLHMLQVFQNLISNSLKYSGDKQPKVHISSNLRGGLCTFLVKDNGVGIAPDYHDRVFLVFKRLSKALPGTGIGLALCRRIVEFYGGKIWIESNPEGCTFLFTAPLAGNPHSPSTYTYTVSDASQRS